MLALSTAQLLCGTILLALVAPLTTLGPDPLAPRAIGSVLVLGALGTGLAYILNNSIIRAAGATTASTVAYVVPLFSTLIGLLVGESLTWNQPVGGIVVLLGVAVSQGRVGGGALGGASAWRAGWSGTLCTSRWTLAVAQRRRGGT